MLRVCFEFRISDFVFRQRGRLEPEDSPEKVTFFLYLVVLVLGSLELVSTWKFAHELLRRVNQDRQALRTNPQTFPDELNFQERNDVLCPLAAEAPLGFSWHLILLQRFYFVPIGLYSTPS